jgi:flagellar protein FliL
MAKDKSKSEADEPEKAGDGAEGDAPKKRFGKKFLLLAGAGALVLVLGLGGGAYFFFFSGSSDAHKTKVAGGPAPLVAPQVAFFDMPDIVVNIQTADGTPAYLKLSVSLELDGADEKPGLQALMPRIVDQFQSYLRELRVDDLRGSAGVMRLKEELLRRINVAAAPFSVRDVLLKEMIVQ